VPLTNDILRQIVGVSAPANATTEELLRLLAGTSDLSLETNDLLRLLVGSTDKTLLTNELLRLKTGAGYETALTNDLLQAIQTAGGFFPFVGAAADNDFKANRYSGQTLTTVRSTSTYVQDSAGLWSSVAANVMPRSDKGVLIEGAQTNLVLWNSDLTNAAWTKTSATAALTEVGFDGTVNGASLLTATSANGQATQAITSASALRTTSVFLKRVTGTGTVQITQDGTTWATVVLTSSWQRFQTASATAANPVVGVRLVTSGDAVAVDMVQNETWSSGITTLGGASSPIRTTTASVTRAATVLTASLTGLTAATLIVVARTSAFSLTSNQSFASISDGTTTNRLVIFRAGGNGTGAIDFLALPGAQLVTSSITDGTRFAAAGTATTNDRAVSLNGAAVVTDATANGFSVGLSQLRIGDSGAGAGQPFGYIERVVVLPVRTTNTELTRLSALATWGG
jgi:hypothetical protein